MIAVMMCMMFLCSDSPAQLYSEIPSNLSHLFLCAILLSFTHGMCIFFTVWWWILLWSTRLIYSLLMQSGACAWGRGGRAQGLGQRTVLCQSNLTSWCHNVSISLPSQSDVLSLLPFNQLQEIEREACISPSILLPSPLIFSSIPRESLLFICMFCNFHSFFFYSQHFSP